MADRPILFSAPMVRALLDGRKTQTRRILKLPKGYNVSDMAILDGELFGHLPINDPSRWGSNFYDDGAPFSITEIPSINVGDRLWVRESIDNVSTREKVAYKADWPNDPTGLGWRPSIHMPRFASRLTLTVTDVRVQRLQDISEEDAIAEGITRISYGSTQQWANYPLGSSAAGWTKPRTSYSTLWNSINGPGAWEENPWVAAYSFTVERKNIDEAGQ